MRLPLWEKRANNPPRLIGYLNTDTREVYTARGEFSQQTRPLSVGFGVARSSFNLPAVENNAHQKRMAAITHGDETGDYTYYG